MANHQPNRKHILIIDNNCMNIRLYSVILSRLDVEIHIATNEIEAIEKVVEFKPDMVIIEIAYPPISNISFLKKIRNKIDESSTQIVAVSSCVMKGDKDFLISSGCNIFIPVPIDTRAFYQFFEKSLF